MKANESNFLSTLDFIMVINSKSDQRNEIKHLR